jgi:hypothetical protein
MQVPEAMGSAIAIWRPRQGCYTGDFMRAVAAEVQWVASCGGGVAVSATTRSITSWPSGFTRDGRVLSRKSPATPVFMNRSCQRHTQVFDWPSGA